MQFSCEFCTFGVVEASCRLPLAMLARCCLQDCICLASWGRLETMLRHVGAKMAMKSAKMSQHERNWCLRGTRLGAMDAPKGGVGPLKVESNQPQRPRLSNLQLPHCTHYAPKARWRIYYIYIIFLCYIFIHDFNTFSLSLFFTFAL